MIRFTHHSYLYLFAAKAATNSEDFRQHLLKDPILFAPVLKHYAALKRQDGALLIRLEKLLEDVQRNAEHPELRKVEIIDAPSDLMERLEHALQTDEDRVSGVSGGERNDRITDIDDVHLSYEEPDAFPLALPEDLPPAFLFSITLDVTSIALRDCDQVPDPALKLRLLKKVLKGWGTFLGIFESDPSLRETMRTVAESTAQSIEIRESERDTFVSKAVEYFPPIMAMSGIASALSTRRLLIPLYRALDEGDFDNDPEGAVAAALMLFDMQNSGWPERLRRLTRPHTSLEVFSGFLVDMCTYELFEGGDIKSEEEASLYKYVAETSASHYRFKNEPERKRVVSNIEQVLRRKRTQHRALRTREGKELPQGLSIDSDQDDQI